MKKIVNVTITKTLEIDIPDEILGETAITKFSSYLYDIDSIDEIFEHAGHHIVVNDGDGQFADYIGFVGAHNRIYPNETVNTTYKILSSSEEFEVE